MTVIEKDLKDIKYESPMIVQPPVFYMLTKTKSNIKDRYVNWKGAEYRYWGRRILPIILGVSVIIPSDPPDRQCGPVLFFYLAANTG